MQCCETIEALGGLPRFPDNPEGRAELAQFQKRVYKDVFGTDSPVFQHFGKMYQRLQSP